MAPRLGVCLLACAAVGCAMLSPLPDMRTLVDRAREVSPRCREVPEADMAPLLSVGGIDTVQASYANVSSGVAALEKRLRGARIRVRPTLGMSSEGLTRSLECHQARVALAQIEPLADDPYVLPGRWLDLDAASGRDTFDVTVSVDDFEDARLVLARARRFVAGSLGAPATRPTVVGPPPVTTSSEAEPPAGTSATP
jgi:hypothetical protein